MILALYDSEHRFQRSVRVAGDELLRLGVYMCEEMGRRVRYRWVGNVGTGAMLFRADSRHV